MNARLVAVSAVGGFALAALLFAPQISAQPAESAHGSGIFASLKVGQMVEFTTDVMGIIVRTWEDEQYKPGMKYKVKEIGSDYLVLEFVDKDAGGAVSEYRLPVYRFASVTHMGRTMANPPGGPVGMPAGSPDKKGAAPDKKPGMTKKKT